MSCFFRDEDAGINIDLPSAVSVEPSTVTSAPLGLLSSTTLSEYHTSELVSLKLANSISNIADEPDGTFERMALSELILGYSTLIVASDNVTVSPASV